MIWVKSQERHNRGKSSLPTAPRRRARVLALIAMKHRWMDVVKRSKDALSPRSDSSGPHTRTPPRSQYRSQSCTADMLMSAPFQVERAENPAFFHVPERCQSAGSACSVSSVLEQCVLQGGVHHTHLNVLTHLGAPLRADTCCYGLSVQWFRAFGAHDDFQAIPGACHEYFTATADDIGARILVKVMLEDEDVVKTKMLEYGPIKEDPEVRSKVEMYLERQSVLFMVRLAIAKGRQCVKGGGGGARVGIRTKDKTRR